MSVAASSASTTGRPMVRFGTKWPSITSTCSQSAPSTAARPRRPAGRSRRTGSTARSAGARRAGYAHRVESPRRIGARARLSPCAAARREHGVGAVPVRPQLHGRARRRGPGTPGQARPGVGSAPSGRAGGVGRHHADGLGQVRRARGVGTTPPGRVSRSPRPAARAAAWSAPARRRAGAASAPRAGGAARPARCTARRPAPGRSRRSERGESRPSEACTVTGSPRGAPHQLGTVLGRFHGVQGVYAPFRDQRHRQISPYRKRSRKFRHAGGC